MCECVSRRDFLGMAGAALVAGSAARLSGADAPSAAPPPAAPRPARIRKIYLAKPVPTWPKPSLDVRAEVEMLERHLAEAAKRVPGVTFTGGELLRVAADAEKLIPALKDDDGLLIFNLTSTVGHLIRRLVDSGKPSALFSQPYSGHDWSDIAALQKAGKKIVLFSTSDYGELADATRLVSLAATLRGSRIARVSDGGLSSQAAKAIADATGVEVLALPRARLAEIYETIDPAAGKAEADEWIRGAQKVVEPTPEEIAKSGRLYLAMREALAERGAGAITIDCLTLFYAKLLPAYPCLGFCKLNDIGLVGACEGDVDSTLTMLVFGKAFGLPGFISDPVIDTSKNVVIHAHCVSPTRMDGPGGAQAPYIIRSHMEDNRGASLQVKMRIGQPITCAKIVGGDTILVSTGKIIDNPDVDRGCRTKIATEVADARRLLDSYTSGLHRVIFYGDLLPRIRDMAHLMGWKVVQEA